MISVQGRLEDQEGKKEKLGELESPLYCMANDSELDYVSVEIIVERERARICFTPFRPVQNADLVQWEMLFGLWRSYGDCSMHPIFLLDKCNASSISSDHRSNSFNPGCPEIKKSI